MVDQFGEPRSGQPHDGDERTAADGRRHRARRPTGTSCYPEHPVNELLSNKPGSQSPFGDDITFPLPVESLYYSHPGPDNRPHLAWH